MNIGLLETATRAFFRRYFGKVKRFKGTASEICKQIIELDWNETYFQTGLGHFNYFWARDFGVVTKSLIKLGHKKRVHKTIEWALNNYIKAGRFALSIDNIGGVFDEPTESIDGLAWFVYSIYVSEYNLSKEEKSFLSQETLKFNQKFINQNTGELNDVKYSELRDAANYKQSCYSILMIYILAKYTRLLKIDGFSKDPEYYKDTLLKTYWNGEYFNADIDNKSFSSECNLFPFILEVFTDKEMFKKVLNTITKKRINRPYPLKYTDTAKKFRYYWWGKLIMPNYEGSTVWTWMGAIYLQLLQKYEATEFKHEFLKFTKIIEKYHNFPELLEPDGNWYKAPLYKAEEGMIWSALYLELCETNISQQ